MTPHLTAQDVARILNCSLSTAYERMKDMPHFHDGGLIRVSQEDFAEYLKRHTIYVRPRSKSRARAASTLYEERQAMRHG